ncbi:hypothetical protein RhiirA5_411208 [Rhizophagus irregularis]|uniref:FAR1 domain-containing protein n=1 Tax=Rhizophagus irregularis TaxID=588596 RepID=A0A2N0Q1Q3_9GLOM|nr:hypothetical protein RhiirA5_411208 [Rhizophagus irregularis]
MRQALADDEINEMHEYYRNQIQDDDIIYMKEDFGVYIEEVRDYRFDHIIVIGKCYCGLLFIDCFSHMFDLNSIAKWNKTYFYNNNETDNSGTSSEDDDRKYYLNLNTGKIRCKETVIYFEPILPPPPAIYNSADELYHNVQTFANSQGYALVKKRTHKNRYGELKNITLCCDRGGVYNNSLGLTKKTRKRHKGTRLIDCPFELYAARDSDKTVATMTVAGLCPQEILLTLRQNNSSTSVISRDIHNTRE